MPSTRSRYMNLEAYAAEVSATVLTELTVRKSTLRRQPSHTSLRRMTTQVALCITADDKSDRKVKKMHKV